MLSEDYQSYYEDYRSYDISLTIYALNRQELLQKLSLSSVSFSDKQQIIDIIDEEGILLESLFYVVPPGSTFDSPFERIIRKFFNVCHLPYDYSYLLAELLRKWHLPFECFFFNISSMLSKLFNLPYIPCYTCLVHRYFIPVDPYDYNDGEVYYLSFGGLTNSELQQVLANYNPPDNLENLELDGLLGQLENSLEDARELGMDVITIYPASL